MVEALNVFIDHAYTVQHSEGQFAKKLKDRLNALKKPLIIKTFDDIDTGTGEDEWEMYTLESIINADIVIPVITSKYLSFVTHKIESQFNRIIDSNNKYLFPILLKPCNWSTFNWIVKSKLIPEDNTPLLEHSDEEIDEIINTLVRTIDIIVSKPTQQGPAIVSSHLIKNSENNDIVFISHDHDDADFAELLKLQLEKSGIIGWIDSERLKIGQDWRQEIDEGIANALAVIAIMTPEAKKSEYVTYEWAFAWGKGKPIFPIMLKQTQLHPRLESLQYLDFTVRNNRPYVELIESIKALMIT